MIARMVDASYARRIEARLAHLDRVTYERLRLHYGGGSFPGEVSPSALLAPSARALCLGQLKGRLKKATKAADPIEVRSLTHLVESLASGGVIPSELLRDVLRTATPAERASVYAETKDLLDEAKTAYESVRVAA